MIRIQILGLGLIFAMALGASSTDRPGSVAEPAWVALERMLQQEGISTDAQSLIRFARGGGGAPDRWMAIEVLGLRGEKRAIPALREILAGKEESILRETAALALSRLGDKGGLVALRELVKSSQDATRQIFLAARLAELGDPVGYPYVAEASQSKVVDLRFLSASALVAYVPFAKPSQSEIDPVGRLIALARDESAKVRNEAAIEMSLAIAKGADIKEFRPVVRELAAADGDPQVKETASLLLTAWQFEECKRNPNKAECQ